MDPTYHLWLKPSGEAYKRLVSTIRDLSAKLNAPIFEPHVTLLGHLSGNQNDHLRRTTQLARQLHPFAITLAAPAIGDAYFQCVFLKARKTSRLMEARRQARQIFSQSEGDGYLPHVSLLYGLYPDDLKRKLAASLSADLHMTFEATAVYLLRSDSDDPRDWHEVAAVPLSPGPAGAIAVVRARRRGFQ